MISKRLEAARGWRRNSSFFYLRLAGHVFELRCGQARRGVQSVRRILRERRPVIELVPCVDLPRAGSPSFCRAPENFSSLAVARERERELRGSGAKRKKVENVEYGIKEKENTKKLSEDARWRGRKERPRRLTGRVKDGQDGRNTCGL
uniref:Uncharacterized protein n=1 Tax=Timema douglasi TaxID=61478 RepID=A0A7R8VFQ0_TIMDO|nr:unnamed protein product [Timema douglasi]